jgi:hypothetical protein
LRARELSAQRKSSLVVRVAVRPPRSLEGEEAMPSFDQTPDKPKSLGFKVSWFAVKAADPAAVLGALEFGGATPANWASGLAAMYEDAQSSDPWVFASPPVSGWVLLVGSALPYPTNESHHEIGRRFDVLFSRLMKRFDDVQFFGSHRVVDFVTWARARSGKPVRIFGLADEVMANFGEQTPEEAKLGFVNLSGLSPPEALDKIFAVEEEQGDEKDKLVASGLSLREALTIVRQNGRRGFPDETDVVDLAALWSIDPGRLSDQDHPLGLGRAARLPKNLAQ